MGWYMNVGQLTSSLHGVMKSSQHVLFRRMMNSISQPSIQQGYVNVLPLAHFIDGLDCVAVGSALAAHFSYYWQRDIAIRTDVLDRYRAIVQDRLDGNLIMYEN